MLTFNQNQVLQPDNNFNDLSLTDLIEARDHFHVHLINKKNVIATALGRYRIRREDPRPGSSNYEAAKNAYNRPARTLENSEVRDYSWPCILVFVSRWMLDEELLQPHNYADIIPKSVYMPDGRIVPICVVEAPKDDHVETFADPSRIVFPQNLVGGGFPLLIVSQGVERIASIGCVVTNGNRYFALTNKHVLGLPGTIIYTRLKGVLTPIGKSTDLQLGNLQFGAVYPGWNSRNLFINADIGLMEIDDIRIWKTDVFGLSDLGAYGKLADLNIHNFTLKLVGSPVAAFGSVSGKLAGEITALFYRFKSVGGYEYASDFLIGPRTGSGAAGIDTKYGDSGTLWLLETEAKGDGQPQKELLPIAVQWGQHQFTTAGKRQKGAYALATCLSNVLRMLEVDLVRDWNLDNDYSWGKLGHYSIAHIACGMVKNGNLKELLQNNLEVITFGFDDLTARAIDKGIKLLKQESGFVPLADVPDLVWKIKVKDIYRGKESPNHFADMDKPDSGGETLLNKCKGNHKNMQFLTPAEWLSYYNDPAVKDKSKGLLPFRVWQIFNDMVQFATDGDVTSFVTAAGILAHYVGDACQPLHISFMFDGIPQDDGSKKGEHVHSIYETTMVNKFIGEIFDRVNQLKNNAPFQQLLDIDNGKEAAGATVELMKKTFRLIKPKDLVDIAIEFRDEQELGDAAVAEKLWEQTGAETTGETFTNGAYYLASLWENAWRLGKGSHNIDTLDSIDMELAADTYKKQDFLPSVNIKEIGAVLGIE